MEQDAEKRRVKHDHAVAQINRHLRRLLRETTYIEDIDGRLGVVAKQVVISSKQKDSDFYSVQWLSAIVDADPYWDTLGRQGNAGGLITLLRSENPLSADVVRFIKNLVKRHQLKPRVAPRNLANRKRAECADDRAKELCNGGFIETKNRAELADLLTEFVLTKTQGGSEVPVYCLTSPHESRHEEALENYRAAEELVCDIEPETEIDLFDHVGHLGKDLNLVKIIAEMEGLSQASLELRIEGKHHSSRRFQAGRRGRAGRKAADS